MSSSEYCAEPCSSEAKKRVQSYDSQIFIKNKEQNKRLCQICELLDDETKLLILNFIEILAKIDISQIPADMADNGGFSKLMKIIFSGKYKNFSKCQHSKIQQIMIKQMGIDTTHLDLICNKKMLEMGKYCYQIDTISQQVKTYHRHFGFIEKRKIFRKNKGKDLSPISTEKTDPLQKKLEQNKQKPVVENQERLVKQEVRESSVQQKMIPFSQLNSKIKSTGIEYEEMPQPTYNLTDPIPNHLQMNPQMPLNGGMFPFQYSMHHYPMYSGMINGWPYIQQ